MARKLRVSYPCVAEHIIQHGNNRQVIFANAEDTRADYSWSSYQCNALGKRSSLLTEHPLYTGLGDSPIERQTAFRYSPIY